MIDFYFWQGCPSYQRALARLREAMHEHGVGESELRITEVRSDDDAQQLGFPGSPTMRFDGVDLQDPGGEPSGLTCRVYRQRDGRPSPLPDPDDLVAALRAYADKHSDSRDDA